MSSAASDAGTHCPEWEDPQQPDCDFDIDQNFDAELSSEASSVCESESEGQRTEWCNLPAPSEASMQAQVDEALRQLKRLERVGINPSELPTIRALFVRWTIFKWEHSLQPDAANTDASHSSASDHMADQPWTTTGECDDESSLRDLPYRTLACPRGSIYKEKATRGIHKRRDSFSSLGQIRGPGSCVVRASRGKGFKPFLIRSCSSDPAQACEHDT